MEDHPWLARKSTGFSSSRPRSWSQARTFRDMRAILAICTHYATRDETIPAGATLSTVLMALTEKATKTLVATIRVVLVPGLALLVAAGCVQLWTYEKPGADEAETRRDMDRCREAAKAPRVPRPLVLTGAAITSAPYDDVNRPEFDACMQRKGYTRLVP